MTRNEYNEKEQEVIGMHKCGAATMTANMGINAPDTEPIFNRPITCKENFKLYFSGKEKPYWMPFAGWMFCDVNNFRPRIIPDNVVTHLVFDGEADYEYKSDTMRSSFFDLEWVYVPVAGGATVKPGCPKIEDMNDWRDIIQMPDLSKLDWEASAKANKEYLDTPQFNQLGILDGLWERLISLMDVDGAAIALIDEDQKDAVKDFFNEYSDFLIDYIRHAKRYYDIDGVLIHDDWGHQNGGFFSLDTAMEMLVPYAKKITDACHDMGLLFELHSCGKNEALVPAYIAAGVDWWAPQPLNDIEMLAKKYKDSKMSFAIQQFDIAPDASEAEQVQFAKDFFEKYKDLHVFIAAMNITPIIQSTIYELSRKYYA